MYNEQGATQQDKYKAMDIILFYFICTVYHSTRQAKQV